MIRRPHQRRGIARVPGMALALSLCAGTGIAQAMPVGRPWASLGALAGSTLFDPHFADYQWNRTPHPAYGAQLMVGTGRFALGARLWRAQAVQQLNLPGTTDPTVHATTFELVGEARLARMAGLDVLARTHAGRLRLGYAPDHATINAGGTPISVDFAPVYEWSGGAGLALRHAVRGSWSVALAAERESFGMDTAYRSGSATVLGRETFGDWSLRMELARVFAGKPEGSER